MKSYNTPHISIWRKIVSVKRYNTPYISHWKNPTGRKRCDGINKNK
jgi:hypothetical protein